jgi:hypothetical protein
MIYNCHKHTYFLPWRFALPCRLASIGCVWLFVHLYPAYSQTINNNGFCNIIIIGSNNNSSLVCSSSGLPKVELFDPPSLWLGMDISKVRTLVGARNPVESEEGGLTVIKAHATLFGLPGTTRYGFDASGKLSWMSVEAQCTEGRHDYTLKTQPPDLNPSWLTWRRSSDWRLSYETITDCSHILDIPDKLQKLFGAPSQDRSVSFNVGSSPSPDEVCDFLKDVYQPCQDGGASRSTVDLEFIGTDRETGIGIEIRELMMHAELKFGDYYPTVWRREIVGIVSVWGSAGRPYIEPLVYSNYAPYLGPSR